MREGGGFESSIRREKENEYKKMLGVHKVETASNRSYEWRFSVSENFTLFITAAMHEHLYKSYGVDPDLTLVEGYISFDDNGKVKEVRFKPPFYQSKPAFKGGYEKLELLKTAARELIEESLNNEME